MGFFNRKTILLTKLPNREDGLDLFRTEEVLQYIDDEGHIWRVPSKSITDGASIPKFFWRVVGNPFEEYLLPAIVHDYFWNVMNDNRKKVNIMFLNALKDVGIPKWKRKVMYAAVGLNAAVKGNKVTPWRMK